MSGPRTNRQYGSSQLAYVWPSFQLISTSMSHDFDSGREEVWAKLVCLTYLITWRGALTLSAPLAALLSCPPIHFVAGLQSEAIELVRACPPACLQVRDAASHCQDHQKGRNTARFDDPLAPCLRPAQGWLTAHWPHRVDFLVEGGHEPNFCKSMFHHIN